MSLFPRHLLSVFLCGLSRPFNGIDTGEYHHYFHTDLETPQTVPWTGLEASARAYAKRSSTK